MLQPLVLDVEKLLWKLHWIYVANGFERLRSLGSQENCLKREKFWYCTVHFEFVINILSQINYLFDNSLKMQNYLWGIGNLKVVS